MDELEILIQAILSLKNINKSKHQILSELPKLEQRLQSDKNARVKIVAGLDIQKSKTLIQAQLNTLSSKIKSPTIKIGINTGTTNNNSSKINTISEQQKVNAYLAQQVKLQNEIYNIQIKQSQIEESKRSSSKTYLTLSKQLETRQKELSLLQSGNSEMAKLISVECQKEKVAEQTVRKREAYELAIAKSKDRELSLSQNINQQSKNSLENEIKKGNQLERQIATLKSQIATYQSTNTRSSKFYESDFGSLIQELDLAKTPEDVAKVRAEFNTLKSEIKIAGKEGKTFWQTMQEGASKFSSWMTLTSIISAVARDIKKMVTNVIELDSAMTNLKKVTDETDSTYERFLKNTTQQAKELKIGLSDLINQTAEWAKKGYNISESSIASKASGIYSVVGEVDNTTAVQDLTTVIKSYDMAIEDSIDIVDKFNNISNKYSVNAADIGKMLSNSVSSLSIAGNSLDQAIAMGTTITEITGDASEAGKMIARAA